jgi:hypothetical protein
MSSSAGKRLTKLDGLINWANDIEWVYEDPDVPVRTAIRGEIATARARGIITQEENDKMYQMVSGDDEMQNLVVSMLIAKYKEYERKEGRK